jgi:hypothetical protein
MNRECSICLRDEENILCGGIQFKKITCGHYFHTKCINLWVKRSKTCPLCRAEIIVVIKEKESKPEENKLIAKIKNNYKPPACKTKKEDSENIGKFIYCGKPLVSSKFCDDCQLEDLHNRKFQFNPSRSKRIVREYINLNK